MQKSFQLQLCEAATAQFIPLWDQEEKVANKSLVSVAFGAQHDAWPAPQGLRFRVRAGKDLRKPPWDLENREFLMPGWSLFLLQGYSL